MTRSRLIMLGKAAIELRCAEHNLRRLCDLDMVPYERAGKYRVFNVSDLPKIRAELVKAGYLQPEAEGAPA